ncbi:hypothetical protein F4802DRAFT_399265 [Xylaria palmicola]|nr:hypothetical protein F4802DRAFT_399265 [Xylaria palmicola]
MESTGSRKEGRERLHRRAISQASTASSMMPSPKTTKSTSSSASHPRANTPSNAHRMHGHHRSHTDREPPSSVEMGSELRRSMTPASSLLQEKLQQERRAESERLASRLVADLHASNYHARDENALKSPTKRYEPAVGRRPTSSHDDDSSQTSMGAKQVEKAVSTLHKQNFDLKLELFHRREKQSTLERRVEELEAERRKSKAIQDNLAHELADRDKAIKEAVNMIVKLEARVDILAREKELACQIEAEKPCQHSWYSISDSLRAETPKPSDYGGTVSPDTQGLERMPSFLSDRSAHTQYLRSIVLQNQSSFRHIRKVSEVSASSAEVSEANHIASPSLSMLSESSFVSIYGSKQGQEGIDMPLLGDVSGMDGTFGGRSPTPTKTVMDSLPIQNSTVPNRTLGLIPRPATSLSGKVTSMNDALREESPLKEIYTPEEVNSVDDTLRTFAYGRRRSVMTPTVQFMGSPSKARGRRERRETLQKVMTNYPTYKELANAHTLPPTPDTVSSSVLRKHKDHSSSQDSLSRYEDTRVPRGFTTSSPHGTEYMRSLAGHDASPRMNAQMTSSSVPPRNRSELPTPGFIKVDQNALLSDLNHLVHSATNSTSAGRSRSDSFASDSDSDGGADARSDIESCDYWMRESYKSEKGNKNPSARPTCGRPPSPDLFSFPANSEGWQPDAMFGALRGNGFLGSPVPALRRDPIDELASSLRSPPPDPLEATAQGPPPPSRRSSLNNQGAGHFLLSSLTGKTGKSSSREGSIPGRDARGRRYSMDGSGLAASPEAPADVAPTTKRSQYPPISGLHSRGRGLGLNSLFRRSGPENYGAPLSATESTFPPAALQRGPPLPPNHLRNIRRPSGRMSVPPPATMPWATRPTQTVEDELASATPPPIMRNRPPPVQTDLSSSEVTTSDASQAVDESADQTALSTAAESATPVAPQNGGGMRKWLGLGKKASPKTRAG